MISPLQQIEWRLNLESAKEDITELLDNIDKSADLIINFKQGYIKLVVEDFEETYTTIDDLIHGLIQKGETNAI